ncbi:MAG TPA: hypothetical protein VJH94_05625 [Candidatus Paceibacterota bacterium]
MVLLAPLAVSAAPIPIIDGLVALGPAILKVLSICFQIMIAISVIVILWGIVQMMVNADKEEARTAGRLKLMWALVSILMIVSVWGLAYMVVRTFTVDTSVPLNAGNFLGGINR